MSAGKKNGTTASVICLGTGDGWPNGERNHSSYLYTLGTACFLIDCGESVCRSLTARQFDWNRIDAILISHTHSDHVGGLFMLLQGMWLDGRDRELNIHLPGHFIKPLRQMLKHVYLFEELFNFHLNLIPLEPNRTIRIGAVQVRAHPNSHLAGLKKSFAKKYKLPFESYSFSLSGAGRRIAHSADIGPPSDLKPLLRHRCDLLVCELAHFTPSDLIEQLRGRPIERLALVHVSRAHRKRLAAIESLFARELPAIRTTCPLDGARIRL